MRPSGSSVFCTSADDPILDVLNVIYCSPMRILSSCLPILSGLGHFLSTWLRILLYFIIRFSYSTTVYDTYTALFIFYLICWSASHSCTQSYLNILISHESPLRNLSTRDHMRPYARCSTWERNLIWLAFYKSISKYKYFIRRREIFNQN